MQMNIERVNLPGLGLLHPKARPMANRIMQILVKHTPRRVRISTFLTLQEKKEGEKGAKQKRTEAVALAYLRAQQARGVDRPHQVASWHKTLESLRKEWKAEPLPPPPKDWEKRWAMGKVKEWPAELQTYYRLIRGYKLDYENQIVSSAPPIPVDEWGFESKQTWLLSDEFEETTQTLRKIMVTIQEKGEDKEVEAWRVVRTVKRFRAIDSYQPPSLDSSWSQLRGLLDKGKITFVQFTELQSAFVSMHNEEVTQKELQEEWEISLSERLESKLQGEPDGTDYNSPQESDEVQNWSHQWRPMFLSKEEFFWDGLGWQPLSQEYSTHGRVFNPIEGNEIMQEIDLLRVAVLAAQKGKCSIKRANVYKRIKALCQPGVEQATAWRFLNEIMDDLRLKEGKGRYWTLTKGQRAILEQQAEDKASDY